MKKNRSITILISLLLIVMTACVPVSRAMSGLESVTGTPASATQAPVTLYEAEVQSVEIQFTASQPVQVNAIVRGNLSESCAKLVDSQTSFNSNTFTIRLMASSPTDRGCVQLITPYEETITLDTASLEPGTYTVMANKASAVFTIPGGSTAAPSSMQVVVQATDGSLQIANLDLPLNPTARPTFNNFLPYGGSAEGKVYLLDPNQSKAVVMEGKSIQDLTFVQNPTPYGLAVWPGDGISPSRLAWATLISADNQSSSIKISTLDGKQIDTLLTLDAGNPPAQLMAQFFSPDGQWLYFSKEPVGIGGFILFSGASNLYKINLASKEVTEVIAAEPSDGAAGCLDAVSADLRYVAEHCTQNVIRIRDLSSGGISTINPPAEINTGNQLVGSARFSPDGKKLAYAIGKGTQADVQGWVVVSDTAIDNSMVLLISRPGSYYTVAGWLDDETLLVQSTNPSDCTPYCKSELFAVLAGGSDAKKVADGSFVTALPNEAIIQLPVEPPPTPVTTSCQDAAQYISDDGKDGSTYAPNTAFTKTWSVKNTGTCTWDNSYMVFQLSGTYMTQQPGYWLVGQGQTVKPGQTLDISVGMTSPTENGNYRSYWVIKNTAGKIIPLEDGTDEDAFYVDINVDDGTADGNVTSTSIDIVQEQGSGEACTAGATYFVRAKISTDGPGRVAYEIGSTAGQISAGYFEVNGEKKSYVTGNLEFEQADTQTVKLRFVGPYPYPTDISVNLRANSGEWVTAKLYCP